MPFIWLAGNFWQRQSEEWRRVLLELVVLEHVYPSMVCQWPTTKARVLLIVLLVADLQRCKISNGISDVLCVSNDELKTWQCPLHNVNAVWNFCISIELLTDRLVSVLFLREKNKIGQRLLNIFFSQLDKLDPLRWSLVLHSTSSTIYEQYDQILTSRSALLFSLSGYHIYDELSLT